MNDMKKQAKVEVLRELMQMAKDAMGSRVKGDMDEMRKVTVAAPDKKSLLEGLDTAEDLMENSEVMEQLEDSSNEESSEDKEPEQHSIPDMKSLEDTSCDDEVSVPMKESDEEDFNPFAKRTKKPATDDRD